MPISKLANLDLELKRVNLVKFLGEVRDNVPQYMYSEEAGTIGVVDQASLGTKVTFQRPSQVGQYLFDIPTGAAGNFTDRSLADGRFERVEITGVLLYNNAQYWYCRYFG